MSNHSLLLALASRYCIHHRDSSPPDFQSIQGRDGVTLAYLDWGGTNEPVLFLHGGALTSHSWDLVCLGLRDHWHCLALDMRGHGDSGWSNEYSAETAIADIVTLLKHVGVERVHLVGNSLGGMVAAHFAATHPAQVSSLTLVDIGPNVNFEATQTIRAYIERTEGVTSIAAAVAIGREFNARIDLESLEYRLRYAMREGEDRRLYWKQDRRGMENYEYFLGKVDEIARLAPAIAGPVLVLRGARSRVFSDEAAADCAALFPNGRWLRIEEAGHNIQESNPAGLVAALERFWNSLSMPHRENADTENPRQLSAGG
jgi:pimeloyl-ACP methyl ester carboxylesterase